MAIPCSASSGSGAAGGAGGVVACGGAGTGDGETTYSARVGAASGSASASASAQTIGNEPDHPKDFSTIENNLRQPGIISGFPLMSLKLQTFTRLRRGAVLYSRAGKVYLPISQLTITNGPIKFDTSLGTPLGLILLIWTSGPGAQ